MNIGKFLFAPGRAKDTFGSPQLALAVVKRLLINRCLSLGIRFLFVSLVFCNLLPSPNRTYAAVGYSDIVGFYEKPIYAGTNFMSVPLLQGWSYRGTSVAITSNSINFSPLTNFTAGEFGTTNVYTQYSLMVKKDADQDTVSSNSVAGHWWPILSNSASTVYLNTRGVDITSLLSTNDMVEIRRMTSLRSLFGYGTNIFLNIDSDLDPVLAQEDILRFMGNQGTGYSAEIFYADDTWAEYGYGTGYYVQGEGPFDGLAHTVILDEPLQFFRKTGSAATNLVFTGYALTTPLVHYVKNGGFTLGIPYPSVAVLSDSNLKESGWIMDSNLVRLVSEEDSFSTVNGETFITTNFLHDGSLLAPPYSNVPTWIVNGVISNSWSFEPGRGYAFYLKTGSTSRNWRQSVPFSIPPTDLLGDIRLQPPQFSGTNLILSIENSEINQTYAIYWRSDLTTNSAWQVWSSGTQGQSSFTNAKPAFSNAFFVAFSGLDDDSDGLNNGFEAFITQTGVNNSDTDGDGVSDYLEYLQGRNPLTAGAANGQSTIQLQVFTTLR